MTGVLQITCVDRNGSVRQLMMMTVKSMELF